MKSWLSVTDAAEHAGVSRDTIYTACERHELTHARVSGRRTIRVRREWIDAWLERYAVAAHESHPPSHAAGGRGTGRASAAQSLSLAASTGGAHGTR